MTELANTPPRTIQVRYQMPYLTWLRLRAYSYENQLSASYACAQLLDIGLDAAHVSRDPNYLVFGTEEVHA